jgi:glutathione synthase/RimK-type ligase-like ATP-grasp enzyme
MTETTSTLRRVVWLFPDRESTRTRAKWSAAFWEAYQEVAKELGLSFDRVAPEAVVADALDVHNPKFYIDGERVTPHDTLFISSLYSLPYQSADVFNQLALYSVLDLAGFYLPHPPELAAVCNDKLATLLYLRDCPISPVPTVRIGSGRDLVYDEYEVAIQDLPYPAFSKPAGWCSSRGINLARDSHDVRGLLSLAHGGDTTMVFQPYLGNGTADYRVFMVDGQPHSVMLRAPGDGALYPQYSTGAQVRWVPLPEELTEALQYFAQKLPVPYVCVDFLHDGERFWLSEIEFDGGIICPDSTDPQAVAVQYDIIRSRFRAYRAAHARLFGVEA